MDSEMHDPMAPYLQEQPGHHHTAKKATGSSWEGDHSQSQRLSGSHQIVGPP
jgi:hypothetical protein